MKKLIIILIVLIAVAFILGGCKNGQKNIIEIQPEELTKLDAKKTLDHVTYCGSDSLYHYFFHSKLKEGGHYKVLREKLFFVNEFPRKEYNKGGGYKVVLFSVHFDEEKNMWCGKVLEGFLER